VKISQRENFHSPSFTQYYLVQMTDNSSVNILSSGSNLDILKQHTTSEVIKLYCVQYMRDETQSFVYTRAVLRQLDAAARAEIGRLGGNAGLIAILDKLALESGNEAVV
jgi:hypothetical protein